MSAALKPWVVSLAAGLLVGAIYAFLGVRSPAPPLLALLGLLGMVIGEAGFGLVRDHVLPLITRH